jgi:hypothetical protein
MRPNRYQFDVLCRPEGDFRARKTAEWLGLMEIAFGLSGLYDNNSQAIEISDKSLGSIFDKRVNKRSPWLGVNCDFFSIPPIQRDDRTIRFEVSTGKAVGKPFNDFFRVVGMGGELSVPDLQYFRRMIEIFLPFEAYVSESANETGMEAYKRQQSVPKFDRPVLIRGYHYLDKGMAEAIGGIAYCLSAPAWRVDLFCTGVLIQLTECLFDTNSAEHLQIQQGVMKYFDL